MKINCAHLIYLTGAFSVLTSASAIADTKLKQYVPTALGPVPDYISQVDFDEFQQEAYQSQENTEWCWAACLSMVFSFYHHPVSQEKIVSDVFGQDVNLPAGSGATVARLLNREWTDDNGKHFHAKLTAAYDFDAGFYDLNNARLAHELDQNHPVIIAAGTHAMVLTAMEYTGSPTLPANVLSCGVFDPWPGRGARGLAPAEMIPMNLPGGQFRFAATFTIKDVKSDDNDNTSESSSSSSSDEWEEVGSDSDDITIHSIPNWGDRHSGDVTDTVRINNTSDDEEYKVQVKVAVVREDRQSNEINGEVDSGTKSVIVPAGQRRSLIYHLRWSTDDWQPNQQEMPAIDLPKSDSEYSQITIWRKHKTDSDSNNAQ